MDGDVLTAATAGQLALRLLGLQDDASEEDVAARVAQLHAQQGASAGPGRGLFRLHVVKKANNENVRTVDFDADTSSLADLDLAGLDAADAERVRAVELLRIGREEAAALLKRGEQIDQVTYLHGY